MPESNSILAACEGSKAQWVAVPLGQRRATSNPSRRSEEHTSKHQSRDLISYTGFYLKKKLQVTKHYKASWWYNYPSEKYGFVSWDDYSQYMEKQKMFQTTNQCKLVSRCVTFRSYLFRAISLFSMNCFALHHKATDLTPNGPPSWGPILSSHSHEIASLFHQHHNICKTLRIFTGSLTTCSSNCSTIG